jgi:Na+/proline symporter
MSNLSAALNSLSSSTILDFYLRLRPQTAEDRKMYLSRLSTIMWATVLFVLAVLSLHSVGRVVEVGLQIASVAYGAMLGVFLLGVLTRRATQNGAMAGMICGFAIEVYLWQFTHVRWTWWVTIGSSLTFVVGYAVSSLSRAAS